MKKYQTFNEAIQDVVADFVEDYVKFSIHDVTFALRRLVNSDKVKFAFLPYDCKNKERQPVIHSEVKNAFNEMLSENFFPFLQIDYTNGYRLFYCDDKYEDELEEEVIDSVVVGPYIDSDEIGEGKIVDTSEDQGLAEYIENYVNRFFKRNKVYPTLKQIQSTLRRQGNYTCEFLENEIRLFSDLIYVDPKGRSLSKSKVKFY